MSSMERERAGWSNDRLRKFKKILVETADEHCQFELESVEYYLLDNTLEDI